MSIVNHDTFYRNGGYSFYVCMLKYDLPTHILYNVHSKYTTNRSATNIKVAGLIKPVHLSKIAPSDNIGSSERNIGTLQTRRPTLTFFVRSCDGSVADP